MGLFSPFLVIGAGKMGGAILSALCSPSAGASVPLVESSDLFVQDPGPPEEVVSLLSQLGVEARAEVVLPSAPELVMIGVKPQMIEGVLVELGPQLDGAGLVLSIAAGKTLDDLAQFLPASTPIVRAMPNTPIMVRAGMTVMVANEFVSAEQREKLERLFAPTGAVAWLENERDMDAVTAVSGSGPAYVFWLAECLTKAGVEAGLDEGLALKLAENTIYGAGKLMHSSDEVPGLLRENVTSKGGTTAAALAVLMADEGLGPLVEEAVLAAKRRSEEL